MASLLPALIALIPQGAPAVTTVAEGLSVVWDIEFTGRNRAYIVERDNRVRLWQGGKLRNVPYARIPGVVQKGQGGLLDLCLAPDYDRTRIVYFTYTIQDAGGYKLRLARFWDTGKGFKLLNVLFEGPSKTDPAHFGGRITFGPDGKLFLTLGERHDKTWAQEIGRANGKVMRFNPNGTAPRDNPFYAQGGQARFVWTYGHRNPQGIAYDPGTGTLAISEHGPTNYDAPRGFDEVNILRRSANYGWPIIWGGETEPGMRVADKWWEAPVAPGGAAFKGRDLYVPMLGGQSLWRLKIAGGQVTDASEVLGNEYGRLRCATTGPDGALYIGTSNGENGNRVDKVLRVQL